MKPYRDLRCREDTALTPHTDIKKYTTPGFTTITVSIPSLSVIKTLMPRDETEEIYTVIAEPKYSNQKILIEILQSIGIPGKIHPDGHSTFNFNLLWRFLFVLNWSIIFAIITIRCIINI